MRLLGFVAGGLLLAGWLPVAAAPPAPEAGVPPLQVWPSADTGLHRQHWHLRLLPGGELLVGHGHGVALFDGQRWTLVPTPHAERVQWLEADGDGYVAASVGLLLRLARNAQGAWHWQLLRDLRAQPELDFGGAYRLAVLPQGYLVLGPQRLVWLPRDGGPATVLAKRNAVHWLQTVGPQVLVDHREQGLLSFDAAPRPQLQALAGDNLRGALVEAVWAEADGSLLAATSRRGLLRYRDGRTEPVGGEAGDWAQANEILVMRRLPDGRLLLGGSKAGVALFDAQGRLLQQLDRREGLPSSRVSHATSDEQGGAWLATHDGVTRLDLASSVGVWGARQGLEAVNALARHGGHMVLGTDRGLLRLHPEDRAQPLHAVPSITQQVFALASLHGELFAGYTGGVHRVLNTGAAAAEWQAEKVAHARFVYGLLADRGGAARLFAATVAGLIIVERDGRGRWISRGPIDGVPAADLMLMAQDDDGRLWIGSRDGRAWAVQALDGDWAHTQVRAYTAADGLPGYAVTPVAYPGGLFLATDIGPLRPLADGSLESDPRFAGLPRNAQAGGPDDWFRFLPLADGRLWARIGATTGLASPKPGGGWRWERSALRGLANEVVYGFVADPDGSVWAARERSLLRLGTAPVRPVPPTPPRLARLRDARGALIAEGPALAGLALGPEHDALRLEFAWPAWRSLAGARFRSRLQGHEADFTPWAAEPFRDINGLRGGRYLLQLEVMDSFGAVQAAAPWSFQLAPPRWRSPAALAAYALLALAAALSAAWAWARWRTRRLSAQQAELQQLVQLRTAQLAHQAERLQQLDAARSRFYAGVTHEFRTPLMLILEPLRELAEGVWGRLPARTVQPLQHMGRNARRVLALVNQLLDLQSAEAGQLRLAAREADLAALVRGVCAEFETLARRRGIALIVQADAPLQVWFDAALMEAVLSNLVANALKFTPANGEVRVALRRDGEQALLTVADNGPGVADEDRAHLFERFYRAEGALSQPGTGIGLAVVKANVERHGGTVTLGPGPGACFAVRLPLGGVHLAPEDRLRVEPAPREAPAQDDVDERSNDTADGGSAAPHPTTVLVVDDNAELRDFLAARLSTRFAVLQADNGESGWKMLAEALPDMVLSDLSMPLCDGLQLCRRAKSHAETASIPFVLMASRETLDARVRGFDAGADDFIGKPFHTAELMARLAALLASRRQMRAQLAEQARAQAGAPPPGQDPLLGSIRSALLQHLDDSHFGVAELAATLHMDRSTLFKRLKALQQPAPLQLLRELRLDAAAEMLRRAQGQVGEVAYACGFESLSHFSRSFKARFGSTPSEFAQRARSVS